MVKVIVVVAVFLMTAAGILPVAAEEKVSIPVRTEAGKSLKLPGVLHRPSGGGRFPAVVMLCGCAGYSGPEDARHQRTWAERLVDWGYVALQVDSLTPRGVSEDCREPFRVSAVMRVYDAFGAKQYLAGFPFVDRARIAVMGWSAGGLAVMHTIDRKIRDRKATPFKAAVAFYPWCASPAQPDTPVLVLIGRKDEYNSADQCEGLRTQALKPVWPTEFSLVVYPNAHHSFDYEGLEANPPAWTDEFDPEATADAISRTKAFLAKYLGTR
jgi:dienelactone hydrolase